MAQLLRKSNLDVLRASAAERFWTYVKHLDEGSFFSYDKIAEVVGFDPRKVPAGRFFIYSVRDRLTRERGLTFISEPGQGYRISRPVEHVGEIRRRVSRAKKQLNYGKELAEHTDLSKLEEKDRKELLSWKEWVTFEVSRLKWRLSGVEKRLADETAARTEKDNELAKRITDMERQLKDLQRWVEKQQRK